MSVGGGERSKGHRVQAVDVLGHGYGLDHRALVDVRWQRQLHEDAVHAVVLVEGADVAQELLL